MSRKLPAIRPTIFWIGVLTCAFGVVTPAHLNGQLSPIEKAASRLKQMSAAELQQLQKNRADFEKLKTGEQERLRSLHRELSVHPESERLKRIMRQYHDWLNNLTDERLKAKIMDMPPDQRITKIIETRRQQRIDWLGKIGPTRLPETDAVPVFMWYEQMMKDKRELILDTAGQLMADGILELSQQRFNSMRSRPSNVSVERFNLFQRYYLDRLVSEIHDRSPDSLKDIFYPSDIDNLSRFLSDAGREILQQSPAEEQGLLVVRWLIRAKELQWKNRVSSEKLEAYYEQQLTPEARDELDALSADARREKLIELYMRWLRSRDRRNSRTGPRI